MASIFDAAKYILQEKKVLSTWKLQKLCFYSQAWSLAWTEKPIFNEDFQAWSNGPVCPELFQLHKGKFAISNKEFEFGNPDILNDDQRETIDIIIKDYGDMEPYDLREQTHSEAPWKEARAGLPDGVPCTNIITKESMGEYYGSL